MSALDSAQLVDTAGLNAYHSGLMSTLSSMMGDKEYEMIMNEAFLAANGHYIDVSASCVVENQFRNQGYNANNPSDITHAYHCITFKEATEIKSAAFQDNTALTIGSFPKCTSLGDYAFYNCNGMQSLTLGNIQYVGTMALGCSLFISQPWYTKEIICNLEDITTCMKPPVFSKTAGTYLGSFLFSSCTNVMDYMFYNQYVGGPLPLPDGTFEAGLIDYPSISLIGSHAFESAVICSTLCNFSSPSDILVRETAFSRTSIMSSCIVSLTAASVISFKENAAPSISISSSCTMNIQANEINIAEGTFAWARINGTSARLDVSAESGCVNISSQAFMLASVGTDGCLSIHASTINIEPSAFSGFYQAAGSTTFSAASLNIPSYAFVGGSIGTGSIILSSPSELHIGDYAFSGFNIVGTGLTFSAQSVYIGKHAFESAKISSNAAISFNGEDLYIDDYAFYNVTAGYHSNTANYATSMSRILSYVKSIGSHAMHAYGTLTSVGSNTAIHRNVMFPLSTVISLPKAEFIGECAFTSTMIYTSSASVYCSAAGGGVFAPNAVASHPVSAYDFCIDYVSNSFYWHSIHVSAILPKVSLVGDWALQSRGYSQYSNGTYSRVLNYNFDSATEISGFYGYTSFNYYSPSGAFVSANYLYFPNLISITASRAFELSQYDTGSYSLSDAYMPNLEYVADYAFYNLRSIKGDTLDNLKYVGDYAFRTCVSWSLGSLSNLEHAGHYAFLSSKITPQTLDKIEYVGNCAFSNCITLECVSSPSLTYIGNSAFYGCNTLNTLYAPNCSNMPNNAISSCYALTSIAIGVSWLDDTFMSSNAANYSYSNLTTAIFPSLTSLSSVALNGARNIEYLDLGLLSIIESNRFNGRSTLTNVSCEYVETIESQAFSSCSKLLSINCENVESVGAYAFYACYSLASFYAPKLTSIEHHAFYGASSLSIASFPLVSYVDSCAFSAAGITVIDMPELTNTWYSTLSTTAYSPFPTANVYTYINTPKWSTFSFGLSMKNVSYFAHGMSNPTAYLSSASSALKTCILPNIKYLSSSCFMYCSKLEHLDLGPSCSYISYGYAYTFYGCSNLSEIYLRYPSVVSCQSVSNMFASTKCSSGGTGTIYVPASLVDTYKTHTSWKYLSNRFQAIPEE